MAETKGKTLLVSYNQIEGFPEGKYEDDKVIVLSKRSGGVLLGGRWVHDGSFPRDDIRHATSALEEAIGTISETIRPEDIGEAVIYVGERALNGALSLAEAISASGKKVRIVGCDCKYSAKAHVAQALGVPYEVCECGGVRTMGEIARDYQRN